jgi:hypothetical protein
MTFHDFVAHWILLPLLVVLVVSGLAHALRRRGLARREPGGRRRLAAGPPARVFAAGLAAFAIALPMMEPVPAGERLVYFIAVVEVVFLAALALLRFAFFYRVYWNDEEIEHWGFWRRRRLRWDEVAAAGYAAGIGAFLVDRARRRFWIPQSLDGVAEFHAYALERTRPRPQATPA